MLEDLVSEDSLYRKIDESINFSFIYEEVKDLYCEENGRQRIDPVVLFKLVFIEALNGLKSMRKKCKMIKVNVEHRCFFRFDAQKANANKNKYNTLEIILYIYISKLPIK